MQLSLKQSVRALRLAFIRAFRAVQRGDAIPLRAEDAVVRFGHAGRLLVAAALAGAALYLLVQHPPLATAASGEVGVRTNQLTGDTVQWRGGSVLVLPALHQARVFSVRDQVVRPAAITRADGPAPLQSVEGLSVGVDLSVRFAVDPQRVARVAHSLPDNLGAEIVEPALQGIVYKVFSAYTVREIFSTKRVEIQQAVEAELRPRLAADGLLLRGVTIGKVDLPADYRRGMEGLLAEELQTQRMRYTLELKAKRVKESELEAAAEKVQRETRQAAEPGVLGPFQRWQDAGWKQLSVGLR